MANNMHMAKDDLDTYYSKLDLRGRGSSGNVHIYGVRDEHQNSDFRKQVAVKSIREDEEGSAKREIYNLKRLANEPYIVKILGYSTFPYEIYMECYNTDLSNYVKKRKFGLSQGEVFKIKKDILKGLQTLIKYGIIHRDVKPGNLLVDYNGSDGTRAKEVTVKLGDFGCSRALSKAMMEKGELSELTMELGTNGFMAPEIALSVDNQGSYTAKVDIWGCAASVLFLISNGSKPFSQHFLNGLQSNIKTNEYRDRAIEAKITEIVPAAYSDVKRILLKLLKWSPEERNTPNETLAMVELLEEKDVPYIEKESAITATTYVTPIVDKIEPSTTTTTTTTTTTMTTPTTTATTTTSATPTTLTTPDATSGLGNIQRQCVKQIRLLLLLFLFLISGGIIAVISSYRPKSESKNINPGKVYFIAGGITAERDIELYHPTIEHLTCSVPPPNIPGKWSWHQSFYHNKTIHLCGGKYTASICISYNSQMTGWETHTLNPPRRGRDSVVILQNTLYIIGGWNSNKTLYGPMSTPLPLTGRPDMTPVPNLQYRGIGQCTTKLDEDTLVITGGSDSSAQTTYFSTVTTYNTKNKKEEQLPELLHPRRSHGCVMVEMNSKKMLIVSGGWDGGYLELTEMLEVGGNSWHPLGDLNKPIVYHSMVATSRGVLVMGGEATCCNKNDPDYALDTVQLLEGKEWKLVDPSMNKERFLFGGPVEIPATMFNCTG